MENLKLRICYFPEGVPLVNGYVASNNSRLLLNDAVNSLSKVPDWKLEERSNTFLAYDHAGTGTKVMICSDNTVQCHGNASDIKLEQLVKLYNNGLDATCELLSNGVILPRRSDYLLIYFFGDKIMERYNAGKWEVSNFARQLFGNNEIEVKDFQSFLTLRLMKSHKGEKLEKIALPSA